MASPNPPLHLWMVVAAALAGALGVGFAAAAAHGAGSAMLGSASAMLLAHAPVLLILGFAGGGRLRFAVPCGALIALGLLLFTGDIGLRGFVGSGLFPFAAPLGGMLLILSWLAIALAAVFSWRRPSGPSDGGDDA